MGYTLGYTKHIMGESRDLTNKSHSHVEAREWDSGSDRRRSGDLSIFSRKKYVQMGLFYVRTTLKCFYTGSQEPVPNRSNGYTIGYTNPEQE